MFGLRCLAAILALLLAACGEDGEEQATQQKAPPPGVLVAKAERRDVRPAEQFTGRAEAKDHVDVIARVEGFLEKQEFEEGQQVKAGDLLFRLDQAPFLATVHQREADLARAEAERRNAQVQFERARELLQTKNIPAAEVDKREAEHLAAEAAVKQAQAALDAARIDLSYTEIHAPISGRIGRAAFSVGALVGPRSSVLASIVNNDPIYVTFPVSQRQWLEYRRKVAEGQRKDVVVHLRLADGSRYPEPGKVDFFDIRVDPGTDTIAVRASFPNPQGLLVPGQFANVSVERAEAMAALVVPQSALQIDQTGTFVMVVDDNRKVEARRVDLGASVADAVVVEQGLQPGDQVVIEGAQKVRAGQEVQVSEVPSHATPGPVSQ